MGNYNTTTHILNLLTSVRCVTQYHNRKLNSFSLESIRNSIILAKGQCLPPSFSSHKLRKTSFLFSQWCYLIRTLMISQDCCFYSLLICQNYPRTYVPTATALIQVAIFPRRTTAWCVSQCCNFLSSSSPTLLKSVIYRHFVIQVQSQRAMT